jgi:nucleoside-diphosphate-sugar epimerase
MNFLVQDKDYLFNLAGQVSHTDSMQNPYVDLDINVRAQLSILEACRMYNPTIKIFFPSTRQIYGKPQYLPVDENHPLNPTDVNGIDKISAELYHILYHRVYGIPVAILRLTNTYGPRMRVKDARQTFVGWWIRQSIEGQTIRVFGDGQQLRDLNYIEDVIDAILLIMTNIDASGKVYNLGSQPICLVDLAALIIDLTGKGAYELAPFPPERKAIDIGSYYGNYQKIEVDLGWRPKTDYRQGLKETLSFYRTHLPKYI